MVSIPKDVARRIPEAASKREVAVVVPRGKSARDAGRDPLHSVQGRVVSPLRREDIYG